MKRKMRLKRGNPAVSSFFNRMVLVLTCLALGGILGGCAGETTGKSGQQAENGQHATSGQPADESGKTVVEQTDDENPVISDAMKLDEEELEYLRAFGEGITWERVHVTIPGMKGRKKMIYLSDLHVITENNQIATDSLAVVRQRMDWSSFDGATAADAWPVWTDYLNAVQSDGILFGGDMVDFASDSNIACLKKGLDRMNRPWLYVRADHDLEPFFLNGVPKEKCLAGQAEISSCEEVTVMEYEEFLVVGWNNSTTQLTQAGLDRMKETFSLGKPIILLTHVPIAPLADDSLAEKSREAWNDRVLIWGEGFAYQPNETTGEFLRMVCDENTPVCAILCGHLHFTWDGQVTEKVREHVFSAAFEKHAGWITISGE